MLLHVTATHSEDNCPGYHREKLAPAMEAMQKAEELARQFNIKVHFLLNAAPDHVFYALIEADRPEVVGRFLMDIITIPSAFKVTPVASVGELVAAWKPVVQG